MKRFDFGPLRPMGSLGQVTARVCYFDSTFCLISTETGPGGPCSGGVPVSGSSAPSASL